MPEKMPPLCGLNAVGFDMIGSGHHADNADPLFHQINRRAVKFERIPPARIALQAKSATVAQQEATFVDGLVQSVASIARAAKSGSSAWVIGRPITRIEAP